MIATPNGIAQMVAGRTRSPTTISLSPTSRPLSAPSISELIADDIGWPEGEKDIDSLSGLNLPAFTFGGVGDGLPDGIGHYLKDRRLVILADNDDAGRKHADKKAAVPARHVRRRSRLFISPSCRRRAMFPTSLRPVAPATTRGT